MAVVIMTTVPDECQEVLSHITATKVPWCTATQCVHTSLRHSMQSLPTCVWFGVGL